MSATADANDQAPIVDISDLWKAGPDEWGDVALTIAEACRDFGFFYIKNHGVDEQLVGNVLRVWRHFIALPDSQKCKILSEGTNNFRGYFKFQGETTVYLNSAAESGREADWREGFYTGIEIPDGHRLKERFPSLCQDNKWPEEPADFKETVEEYLNALVKLSFKIMACLALGLGLKHDVFESWFTPYPSGALGMFYYPPHNDEHGPKKLSLGEHTDYGMLTVLMQDDVGGLERCNEDGQWIPVPHIPGTFVINLGDMLEVWSNGMYKATEHRVRKSQGGKDRVSIGLFFDPSVEAVIEVLPIERPLIAFKKRTPNANIKIPVVYGEYLMAKLRGTFEAQAKNSESEKK